MNQEASQTQGGQPLSKLKFYGDIGSRMGASLRKAVPKAEVVSATILSTLALFSQTWAQSWTNWRGVHPAWAAAPLTVVFIHLFLKAIYDKWNERELEHQAGIEAAKRTGFEVAKHQFEYQAQAPQLAEVKLAAQQHANSAPTGDSFSTSDADAWVVGACALLHKTLNVMAVPRFTATGRCSTQGDLIKAIAEFRGVVADLKITDLRIEGVGPRNVDWSTIHKQEDDRRLRGVKSRLREVISLLPPSHEPSVNQALFSGMAAVHEVVHGKRKTNWKSESKASLRAILNQRLTNQYEKCLKDENPELAARSFLESLTQDLSITDLR